MPCAAPPLLLRDPARDLTARGPAPLFLSRSSCDSMTLWVELVFLRPLLGAVSRLILPHLTINIHLRPLSGAASGRTPLLPIISLLRDPARDLPARSPAPLSLSRSGVASMAR